MDCPLKLFMLVFILVPIFCQALPIDATDLKVESLAVESGATIVHARLPRSRGFDNENYYGFGNSINRGSSESVSGRPHGFGQQHGFGGHHHRLGNPFTFGSSNELANDSDEGEQPEPARRRHDHHHRLVPPPYQISGRYPGCNSKKKIADFQPTSTSKTSDPIATTTGTPAVVSPAATTIASVISSTPDTELINIDLRFGRV